MKKQYYLPLILSIAFGCGIAWIDTRPNWDDTGVTIGLVLTSAMLCGGLSPSRAWLWALIVGGIIFIADVIVQGNYGSAIALGFALVGAYAGAVVRKMSGGREKGNGGRE